MSAAYCAGELAERLMPARYVVAMDFPSLPGGDLIERGLADLAGGIRSAPALLVAIGEPRLRELGIEVPAHAHTTPERALYDFIAESAGDGAHSQYNALIRRLVSFERALACAAR